MGRNRPITKAFRWIDKNHQFKNYEDYKALEKENPEAGEYPQEITAFFGTSRLSGRAKVR